MTHATLVDLLRHRAAHEPDALGFTHLLDGETDEDDRTWAGLDLRARAVAAWLQERHARGERVLLMLDEGNAYLDALFGCMYAGALAVPVHPPDPARLERTLPRLRSICADAGIAFVLTSAARTVAARPLLAEESVLATADWLAMDQLDIAAAHDWVDPDLGPDDLAYLQYTSGSTATPKGVMISHRNLTHQLADFDTGYDHGGGTIVTWLPATHDLGLVYGRFMALYRGIRCVYMSPAAFMQQPIRWLQAIHRYRGTHTPSPNFGFEVVVRKTTPRERSHLDLSCVRVVLNGAEPIRQESEEIFVETLAPHGLPRHAVTHAMGMSESTAKIVTEPIGRYPPKFVHLDPDAYERNLVVLVDRDHPHARTVASCGATVLDTRAVIVDPDDHDKLGANCVGELWVHGTTVAQGYWENEEATRETFRAYTSDGDGPFLRTGDLAFEHDGEIYLTGRLKDLVIVRGQNHHPQDLEWTLASAVPQLRPNCAAAFGIPVDGHEQLAVISEVYLDQVADPEPIFATMRRALFEEHGLQPAAIVLIEPRTLPKTSSGKIQRTKARRLFLDGELAEVDRWTAPRTSDAAPTPVPDLAQRLSSVPERGRPRILLGFLTERAAGLLGLDADDLEPDRPLSELGLDSVTAVELVESVGKALGREVAGTVLFDHPTLEALAAHLLDSEPLPGPVDTDVASMTEEEAAAALLRELEDL